jgi:hypothetical protein
LTTLEPAHNTNQTSWRRALNPRPADYKSAALPIELRQPKRTDLKKRIYHNHSIPVNNEESGLLFFPERIIARFMTRFKCQSPDILLLCPRHKNTRYAHNPAGHLLTFGALFAKKRKGILENTAYIEETYDQ